MKPKIQDLANANTRAGLDGAVFCHCNKGTAPAAQEVVRTCAALGKCQYVPGFPLVQKLSVKLKFWRVSPYDLALLPCKSSTRIDISVRIETEPFHSCTAKVKQRRIQPSLLYEILYTF